ncbi:histidine decarboxylase [Stylonychia lemnae]|uniref:Histidine decarboxylase n=1 Tax=Stylonychia lemnae TaxID=5949 RepID=A0A078B0U8_STYLE|nr:histidine decarboxylase [Stylonychia lemnae]|eukprot:CDW87926.1 histidine decarboxylase [Stylonychia lemnae]
MVFGKSYQVVLRRIQTSRKLKQFSNKLVQVRIFSTLSNQDNIQKNLNQDNNESLIFSSQDHIYNQNTSQIKEEVKKNQERDKVAKQLDVHKNSQPDRQSLRTIDTLPRLQLNNQRISKVQFEQFHESLQQELDAVKENQLSFPIRQHDFQNMGVYLKYYFNNYGDSFQVNTDYNALRTRQFENQVIRYFGELYNVPQECDLWGYMPSGQTESNFQAVYFAREYFRNHKNVAVIYTDKTDESINEAIYYLKLNTFGHVARSLNLEPPAGMKEWNDKVPHNSAGQMETESLKAILKPLAEQKIPVLIIANVGTTSCCSYDSTTAIINALKTYEFYNDPKNHWVHVDDAWCGPYLRFLEIASTTSGYNFLPIKTINEAKFDFSLKEVKSITTCIHKWIPCPFPSSVLIIKDKQLMPKDHLQNTYIRGQDNLLYTSRSGHIPLLTWDYLMKKTLNDHIDDAVSAYNMANYVYQELIELQNELNIDLKVQKTQVGLNIGFKKPSDDICYKYGLMVMGDEAHIFIMPDKTKQLCDMFLDDLRNEMRLRK